MSDTSWARYVRRTSGDATGSEIEQRTGIGQSTVSRWFTGGTLPSPAHAAKFAQGYGGNVLEAFVAAGFLTEEDAGMPPRPEVDFYHLVDEDQHLSAQAKVHLKNQYGLLRAASAHSRAEAAAELIKSDPDIDHATKERLLKHFENAQFDVVYSSSTSIVEHPFPQVVPGGSFAKSTAIKPMSEGEGRTDIAVAAHEEDEPIAGEQEQPTEP